MGVNIIFNDHIYHFDDDASPDNLLDETADGMSETKRDTRIAVNQLYNALHGQKMISLMN